MLSRHRKEPPRLAVRAGQPACSRRQAVFGMAPTAWRDYTNIPQEHAPVDASRYQRHMPPMGEVCVFLQFALCKMAGIRSKRHHSPLPDATARLCRKRARTTSQRVCAARLTPVRFTPLQNSHRCRTAWEPLHPLRTGSGRLCASVCLFRRHSMPRNGLPEGNKTRPPYTATRNRG